MLSKGLLFYVGISCLITRLVGASDQAERFVESIVEHRNSHVNERKLTRLVVRSNGTETFQTNTVVELKNGRNRFDEATQQWVEAHEHIELHEGAAVGRGTGHKTIFSANLNDPEGTIDLLTPDKKRLRSQVVGVVYAEKSTGRSVFIAELKDSTGELHEDNSIIYPQAFDAIKADVRYRHSMAGLEQDVIFREKLPRPEEYGLDSRETDLEIWTQFLEAPVPVKTKHVLQRLGKAQGDETLAFGEMEIIAGRAFDLGEEDQNTGILVAKEWVTIDGMTFLIEAAPVTDLRARLAGLPDRAVAQVPKPEIDGFRKALETATKVAAKRTKPISLKEYRVASASKKESFLIAKATSPRSGKGFLFDYTIVSTTSNYTFESDKTYFISGAVTLSGTTTFEGGTVIKYDNTTSTKLTISGSTINMRTSMYRPVVMTAKDDNTVGEQVAAGTPSGYYANPALVLNGSVGVYDLSDFRISHARIGIQIDQLNTVYGGPVFRNFQMVNCDKGFRPSNTDIKLLNGLMWNVSTNFDQPYFSTNNLENITINKAEALQRDPTSTLLYLKNCLLTEVGNQGSYGGVNNVSLLSSNGVYQAVGAAGHYLAPGSQYRNAGSTLLEAGLLADLKERTTYGPVELVGPITADTVLRQQAIRDADTPDLGYHYPPLDWAASNVAISGATVNLTNGVAVGVYGDTGFKLQAGAKLIGSGTPHTLNRLVRYHTAQEIAHSGWNTGANWTLLKEDLSTGTAPEVSLRFTELALLANSGDHFNGGGSVSKFSLADCQLTGGKLFFETVGTSSRVVAFTNSLFERVQVSLGSGTDATISAHGRNNLFYRCAFIGLNSASGNSWEWRDNAFHSSAIYIFYAPIPLNGENAYIDNLNDRIDANQSSDILLTSFNYGSGSLGRFYHSSTNLQDQGSRTAATAGLYHHTTRIGSAKEGATDVDVGFHYVALSSLLPTDTDGDSLADYLEDWNGNNAADSSLGETNWEISENGTSAATTLSVFTILE
ncbi:MAG TPA: hypothetical protein VF773_13420 [Verrucomicrobiae bacterium]